MAVDDLDLLNKELAEVFASAALRPDWNEDLIFVPVGYRAAATEQK